MAPKPCQCISWSKDPETNRWVCNSCARETLKVTGTLVNPETLEGVDIELDLLPDHPIFRRAGSLEYLSIEGG